MIATNIKQESMAVAVQRIASFADTVEMESLMTLLVSSASKYPLPSLALLFAPCISMPLLTSLFQRWLASKWYSRKQLLVDLPMGAYCLPMRLL